MSGPRVENKFIGDGANQITAAELGYAAVTIVAKKGEIGKVYELLNGAEFDHYLGGPVSGYENHYYQCQEFFRNATVNNRCYGRLLVVRTAHYTSNLDKTTLTASKANAVFYDADSSAAITIYDASERDSDLAFELEEGGADADNLFNIKVYENGTWRETVSNVDLDSASANYIIGQVGLNRDWYVEDNGSGSFPSAVGNDTTYGLDTDASTSDCVITAGDGGLSGLAWTDFQGSENVTGNTGMRLFKSLFNTLEKPEVMWCPFTSDAAITDDEATVIDLAAGLSADMYTFAVANGIVPIIGALQGCNRSQIKDYRRGTDYTHVAFGDTTGGGMMIWPEYIPLDLMARSPEIYIGQEGRKAGLLMRVLGTDWIHQAAAGIEDGGNYPIYKLAQVTDQADSDVLDDIGVQVARSDKKNIIDSHKTLSSSPSFTNEQIRREDNFVNHSLNLSTVAMLHKPLTERRMERLEDSYTVFMMGLFEAHKDAFTFKEFDESVTVSVVGYNIVNSLEWNAGKLKTYRKVAWAKAIQTISHEYSHNNSTSEEA